MERGEIVKSKAPSRWMAVFLAVIFICAVAIALFWSDTSNADEAFAVVSAWDPAALRCETVRLWSLPADCVFVFDS